MAVRVAPLNMGSCRRSSALMIASGPTAASPAATARSAPTRVADEASSSARSVASKLVGRRELAEAEVDDPGCSIIRQEHVGQSQIAMRDAMGTQQSKLSPHVGQHAVGQLGGIEAIEGSTGDGLVGEHVAIRLRGGERDDTRGADAEVAGHQRDERLVLDGPAQRRERPLVAEIARLDAAVQPKEQIGAALVGTQRLDEQALARPGPWRSTASSRARRGSACSNRERGTPTEARPSAMDRPVGRRDGRAQAPRRRPRRRSIPASTATTVSNSIGAAEEAGEGRR